MILTIYHLMLALTVEYMNLIQLLDATIKIATNGFVMVKV